MQTAVLLRFASARQVIIDFPLPDSPLVMTPRGQMIHAMAFALMDVGQESAYLCPHDARMVLRFRRKWKEHEIAACFADAMDCAREHVTVMAEMSCG